MKRESHLIQLLKERSLDGVLKKYVNTEDEEEVERFLSSLSSVDLDNVDLLRYLIKKGEEAIDLSSFAPVPIDFAQPYESSLQYARIGADAIKNGRVAFLIFSGGAATRLKEQFYELRRLYLDRFKIDIGDDTDLPKGLLPISPSGYYTFIHLFVEQIKRLQYEYGCIIHLIIMVSSLTERHIKRYFEENNYFGLMRRAVFFLKQRENPRLDQDMDLIFDGERIVTTGDGHGGVYRALIDSHLREELIIRGVESIVMFNVDNPLARFFDPARIGYHFERGSAFTLSVVEKTDPEEKIGVVAEEGAYYRVLEYNLLRDEMKYLRDEKNRLFYSCGHINVNIVNLGVIDRRFSPILYRGKKIIIRDKQISTFSLEWLNQDLITVLDKKDVSLISLNRKDFFLPTKNVRGVDSVESTLEGLSSYYKSILDNTCNFHKSSILDLSPSFIIGERDNHRLRNLTMEEGSLLFIKGCVDADERPLFIDKGLLVEKGASLKIIAENPFGGFDYDYISNSAKAVLKRASKINIKKPLKVRSGAEINILIKDGGILFINSTELSGKREIIVEKDQKIEI